MGDVAIEVIYTIDLIMTIILKTIGIICLGIWIIYKKGGRCENNRR